MTYETTPATNKPSKTAIKKAAGKMLDEHSTSNLLWHIVKRHKTGLLATWAITMTTLVVYPPLPQILLSLM